MQYLPISEGEGVEVAAGEPFLLTLVAIQCPLSRSVVCSLSRLFFLSMVFFLFRVVLLYQTFPLSRFSLCAV